MKKGGKPLIVNFTQQSELLAQYGSVMVFSWIMGYPMGEPDWAKRQGLSSREDEGQGADRTRDS